MTRLSAGCVSVACEHTLGGQPQHIYGYLWTKTDIINERCGAFSCAVPDTVLFKHQKPIKWFFTSKQDKGKILCKSKKNLSVANVLQAFLTPKRSFNTATVLKTPSHSNDALPILATLSYADRCVTTNELVMVVEHLTATELHTLLTTREKPSLCVLQRFVPPRSGYNQMLQSVFTPTSYTLRKCINPHLMLDDTKTISQRTATFEAEENDIRVRDVSNQDTRDRIEHINLEISAHLAKIVGKAITRHVSYFKIGADNKIYLLWSTMISFEEDSRAFAKNHRLALSHCDRVLYLTGGSNQLQSGRSEVVGSSKHSAVKSCPKCNVILPREQVQYLVTFKAIIKHFEMEPRDILVESVQIPPLLQNSLAPMQPHRFRELCQDKSFLYETIELCQVCAQEINNKHLEMSPRRRTNAISLDYRQTKSGAPKPVRVQSARTGRTIINQPAVLQRPASATAVKTRHNFRADQNLPELMVKQNTDEPKHCLQKLADHLQRRYGGPSIRLALSRANLYPPTSTVSLDMLQWVCDPKLLVDVYAYWSEFCKAQGAGYKASSIDMDILDGMLYSYFDSGQKAKAVDAETANGASTNIKLVSPKPMDIGMITRHYHPPAPQMQPSRPNRPRSANPSMKATPRTVRTTRQLRAERPLSAQHPKCLDEGNSCFQSSDLTQAAQQESSNMAESSSHNRFCGERDIDGIACQFVASVNSAENSGTMSLCIDVKQLYTVHDNVTITLSTDTILGLIGRIPRQQIPTNSNDLIDLVLSKLTFSEGHLSVKQSLPKDSTVIDKQIAPILIKPEELTDAELLFLSEALQRTS